METINYQQTRYLTSVADIKDLPKDNGKEVAFIGRSNAGKSSSINVVTGIKGLARTSKTPGRTQMINYFEIDAGRHLVDLPGYGYAKVPRPMRARWTDNINQYLETRQSLRGLVLVMDIRHPLREQDGQIIEWAYECGVAVHVLLTKADKLTRQAMQKTLSQVQTELAPVKELVSVQVFSSHNRLGLDEMRELLNGWFDKDGLS